jgi:hypothetical protein
MRDRGALGFVAHGSPLTHVLIRINVTQGGRDRIATLAHELTHAVEVAEASPPIRTEADLAALYRRIGFSTRSPHEFESARARTNERQARTDQTRPGALPRAPPGANRRLRQHSSLLDVVRHWICTIRPRTIAVFASRSSDSRPVCHFLQPRPGREPWQGVMPCCTRVSD